MGNRGITIQRAVQGRSDECRGLHWKENKWIDNPLINGDNACTKLAKKHPRPPNPLPLSNLKQMPVPCPTVEAIVKGDTLFSTNAAFARLSIPSLDRIERSKPVK